jgi:hypothetical protein
MSRLYLLDGSLHSREADRLVSNRSLEVEAITVAESEMAALFYERGIRELPTLVYDGAKLEGLEQIRAFVERNLGLTLGGHPETVRLG